MHVIATAGHVDHGKSTLVRCLTGQDPDRWSEEKRRGLTIDLGFAWTTLAGEEVVFVDVPGHERFVPNMLAGIGPIPAVLLVVAADEGWRQQTSEHLAILNALGIHHGLLVVTKADVADGEPTRREAIKRLRDTTLAAVPSVVVSAKTGAGIDDLRAALRTLLGGLPDPPADADVRLWIDRSFSIRGAGTVVTGTLTAGALRQSDELVTNTGQKVQVRGLQSLGLDHQLVSATARVAVNLRGVPAADIGRGDALVTPAVWRDTQVIDVRLNGDVEGSALRGILLHIGTAAVPVHLRPLGLNHARLVLERPLPLRVGDRGVLRHPSQHAVLAGLVVLDVKPPALRRRGAALRRGDDLATSAGSLEALTTLRLRQDRFVRPADLTSAGLPLTGSLIGAWYVDTGHWESLRQQVGTELDDWLRTQPDSSGMPIEVLRRRLEVPDLGLLSRLLRECRDVVENAGVLRSAGQEESLAPGTDSAVNQLEAELRASVFQAPTAARLAELGLGPVELAAAVRAGRLIDCAGLVLLPGSVEIALSRLSDLSQPFTVSDARQALDTSRRVALPLLQFLDRTGRTVVLEDSRRRLSDDVPKESPLGTQPPGADLRCH